MQETVKLTSLEQCMGKDVTFCVREKVLGKEEPRTYAGKLVKYDKLGTVFIENSRGSHRVCDVKEMNNYAVNENGEVVELQ